MAEIPQCWLTFFCSDMTQLKLKVWTCVGSSLFHVWCCGAIYRQNIKTWFGFICCLQSHRNILHHSQIISLLCITCSFFLKPSNKPPTNQNRTGPITRCLSQTKHTEEVWTLNPSAHSVKQLLNAALTGVFGRHEGQEWGFRWASGGWGRSKPAVSVSSSFTGSLCAVCPKLSLQVAVHAG